MDTELLERKFQRIGARVKTGVRPLAGRDVSIDVRTDRRGEFFEITVPSGRADEPFVDAIDVRPRERHLLLMVKTPDAGNTAGVSAPKQKFLCGHDERSWFVAAVPERGAASTVPTAMDALKPLAVQQSLRRHRVRFKDRNRRRNAAFVRQGEWFFIPVPRGVVRPEWVLRNEPLRRSGSGGGKPHWAEFLARAGGEIVYLARGSDEVLSAWQYRHLVQRNRDVADPYRPQRRNMTVFVKGRVSHPDHKTIVLPDWHQVVMNTENQSIAMRNVAFID